MKALRFLLVFLTFGCCAGALYAQKATDSKASGGGALTGSVRTADGAPLAKATVVLTAQYTGNKDAYRQYTSATNTGADGTFRFTNLPDGTFAICVQPPDMSQVPSCLWRKEATAAIKNGKDASMAPIELAEAVDLYVRVNDVEGKQAAATKTDKGRGLSMAVQTPVGRIVDVPMVAQDATGFDHHLMVPVDTDITFLAQSIDFAITDNNSNGNAKNNGTGRRVSQTFSIPAGAKQKAIVLTVINR